MTHGKMAKGRNNNKNVMNEECEERQRNSECNTEESTLLKALLPWMENIASLIKTGFEKHLDCLQAEIYTMRKVLDEEKEKRKALEETKKGLEFQVILYSTKECAKWRKRWTRSSNEGAWTT